MRNDPPDCALASTSLPLYQKEEMEGGGTGYLLENQQRYTEKKGRYYSSALYVHRPKL